MFELCFVVFNRFFQVFVLHCSLSSCFFISETAFFGEPFFVRFEFCFVFPFVFFRVFSIAFCFPLFYFCFSKLVVLFPGFVQPCFPLFFFLLFYSFFLPPVLFLQFFLVFDSRFVFSVFYRVRFSVFSLCVSFSFSPWLCFHSVLLGFMARFLFLCVCFSFFVSACCQQKARREKAKTQSAKVFAFGLNTCVARCSHQSASAAALRANLAMNVVWRTKPLSPFLVLLALLHLQARTQSTRILSVTAETAHEAELLAAPHEEL